jgi:peptidoglycan/LPS O-acetylase OafA/YrhL
MTAITRDKPSRLRRAAAAVALAALVAALLYLAISAIYNWYVVLASVVTLGVAVIAAWHILSRRGVARAVASVVAAGALAAFAVLVIATESLIVLGVGLGLAAVSIGAASYALSPVRSSSDDKPAPRARHPVLLMNLKSGGGKAERFRLVDLCRDRGIEPIVLHPSNDLRQLAENALRRRARGNP